MNKLCVCFFFALIVFVFNGCTYDKEEIVAPVNTDCSTVPATYSAQIAPIMQTKCAIANCHNRTTAAGGFVFETYAQVKSATSNIMERVVIQKTMPPTGPLPTIEIEQLRCWINNGALNN